MAKVFDIDIRDQVGLTDSTDITTLNDGAGTLDLAQYLSNPLPSYNAAADRAEFDGTEVIGASALPSNVLSVLQGNTWTIAVNINQSTLASGVVLSFGRQNYFLAVFLGVNALGQAQLLVRDSAQAGIAEIFSPVGEPFSVNTDTVLFAWRNGTAFGVAVGDGTAETTTQAVDLSAEAFDRVGVGAYARSDVSSFFSGGITAVRLYDTDESSNRAAINTELLAGSSANSAPVVNDQTFSVADSASNGTVIGTLVATDSDGTVDSYAISGSTLAIDSSGQITLADNAGIVAGTPITATATVTDNNGDTDTATVTVNVTNSGLTFDCYDADNSNAAITSETLSHVRVLDPADLSEVATATNISISGAGSAEIDTDSVTIGTDYLVIARRSNGDVCEPFLVSAIDLAAP